METVDLLWDDCLKGYIPTRIIPLATAATDLALWLYDNLEFLVINQSTAAVSSTRKDKDVFRPTVSLSASKIT